MLRQAALLRIARAVDQVDILYLISLGARTSRGSSDDRTEVELDRDRIHLYTTCGGKKAAQPQAPRTGGTRPAASLVYGGRCRELWPRVDHAGRVSTATAIAIVSPSCACASRTVMAIRVYLLQCNRWTSLSRRSWPRRMTFEEEDPALTRASRDFENTSAGVSSGDALRPGNELPYYQPSETTGRVYSRAIHCPLLLRCSS
jgi:hypothetical protein